MRVRADPQRALAWGAAAATAAGLLAARVWSTVALGPTSGPDSRWYLVLDWSGRGRPYVVPAFYSLFHGPHSRIAAQAALAGTAWLFAAGVVAFLAAPWSRPVAGALVLLVGWSPLVTYWDRVIYSESLSISLAVASLAAFLLWARTRAVAALAAATVGLGLWALTRAANVPVALFVAAVLLLVARWRREAAIAALLLAVAAVIGLWLAQRETTGVAVSSPTIRAQIGDSIDPRTPNLLGIVRVRLLPNREYHAWLLAHGTPPPTNGADLFEDARFRQWAQNGGEGTYLQFLVTHPAYALFGMSTSDVEAMVAPASFAVSNLDDHRPPSFSTPQWLSAPLMSNLSVLLAAAGAAVALSIPGRRDPAVRAALVALVGCWLAMVVIWNGTVVELERISIANAAALRVVVVALLALATAPRFRSGSATEGHATSRGDQAGECPSA